MNKSDDMISRQAAIEAIKKVEYVIVYNVAMTQEEVMNAATDTLIAALTRDIEELPSAEPEIIRCKDCKYYNPDDRCYLQGAEADDFCSYAERREE